MSGSDTKTKNIAVEPQRRSGAVKVPEPDIEHFELDGIGSSESQSESSDEDLSRRPSFRKTVVRIRTSPVRPAPKMKPSYVNLSDEEIQVTDDEDWDVVPLRETSKSKGKARAVSKRKMLPESVAYDHGQKANVRASSNL